MRQLTKEESGILQRNAAWLRDEKDGKRADLQDADLQGADLAFGCWPLLCGLVGAKADDRLFAQVLFHLTRLDVSGCSGGVREAMDHIKGMAVADLFCEYRDDIKRLEV